MAVAVHPVYNVVPLPPCIAAAVHRVSGWRMLYHSFFRVYIAMFRPSGYSLQY